MMSDAKLLFTDTDSLAYEEQKRMISKQSLTQMITRKIIRCSQPRTRSSEIGMFKNKACSNQIEEFVGIRAKLYSYKMHEDGKEENSAKESELVMRKTISNKDYKYC